MNYHNGLLTELDKQLKPLAKSKGWIVANS